MFQSLAEIIRDGFKAIEEKNKEQEIRLAEIAVEMEYQSCLAELESGL